MTNEPIKTKNTRRRIRVMLVSIGILAIVLVAWWWIERPKLAAEQFIALLSQGQYEEADAMLLDRSSIDIDAAGNVAITSSDGNSITLKQDELPMTGIDFFYFRPREGLGDYLAGRYRFPVVTSGSAVQKERTEPVTISAIAAGSRITIVAIK